MPQPKIFPETLFFLSLLLALAVTGCNETFLNTGIDRATKNPQMLVEGSQSNPVTKKLVKEKKNLTDLVVDLSGEGLFVVNRQSKTTQTIPFEADFTASTAVVSSILGKPTEKVESRQCDAGLLSYTSWTNGLTMYGMQDRFVGWWISNRHTEDTNLATVNGIDLIGKSLTYLKANYNVEVFESSLGIEFYTPSSETHTADNISGFISANEPNGVVTSVKSNIVCDYR